MKEKNQAVPDEALSKEFISQFKTEADVSKFLKQLHVQVLEKMLEGEMNTLLTEEVLQTQKNSHNPRGLQEFIYRSRLNYFFIASSIATATATVAPTIGLLPIPRKPIIST